MSAVICSSFGDAKTIREAQAANSAFCRAINLGYSRTAAQAFARTAKREIHEWETPSETALRIVRPKHLLAHSHITPQPAA